MKKALCAYGPGASHTHYVSITSDNRIRLFDTTSGSLMQELAEQSHLAITYTTLAWSKKSSGDGFAASSSKRKRNAKTSGPDDTGSGLLALGTDKGNIVIWDLAVGRVVNKMSGHSSAITSLSFGGSEETLFSGAAGDKNISQWSTSTGKCVAEINAGKRGTTWLSVNPSGTKLLVASSTMRLYDLASKEKLDKFGKYTQQVRQANFSEDGKFIFSIAPDRISAVYQYEATGAAAGTIKPVHNFALPTLPTGMDVQQMGDEDDEDDESSSNGFHFLSTLEDGSLYVWRWSAARGADGVKRKKRKGSSSKAGANSGAVQTQSPDGSSKSNSGVIQARFVGDRILVAVGDPMSPMFSFTEFLDSTEDSEEGAVKKLIELPNAFESAGMLNAKGKQSGGQRTAKSAEEAHISGTTSSALIVPIWPEHISKRQRGEGNDASEDDDDDDDDDDVALIDRVQELEEQLDQSMATTTVSNGSDGGKGNTTSSDTVTNKNSLIQVLQQALHGNDDALLEHCLGTTNRTIIESTVERMSPSFVIPFLTRVVAKFEARPGRGKLLTAWIQAVIEKHAGYIVSTPSVLKTLSGLHETIDARLGAFKRLLKLSGRLDLVLSQMTVMRNQKKKDEKFVGASGSHQVARSTFVDSAY